MSTKIAIVTGGSHGLGRDIGLNLAWRGIHSIFTYRPGTEPGSGAYASMKGAIEILALYLAKELGLRQSPSSVSREEPW